MSGSAGSALFAVLEAIVDPAFVLDAEYRYLAFNDAHRQVMRSLYGTEIEVGMPLFEAQIVAEDFAIAKSNIDRALAGEVVIEQGYSGATSSRRRFTVAHRPFVEDGRVAGVAVVARDLTEAALADETPSLLRALDSSQVGIAVAGGPDGTMRYVNAAARTIRGIGPVRDVLGLSVEEFGRITGLRYLDGSVVPDDELPLVRAVRRGERCAGEFVVRQPDGADRFIRADAAPVSVSSVAAGVAVFRDITERLQAEAALRDSESRYRELFGSMLEGYAYCRMIFGEDGLPEDWVYLDVNESFERLTGLTGVVGKRVLEVLPTIREDSPELFAAYGRVATTRVPEEFDFDFRTLDMWLHISVLSPQEGDFVAVFEDITERKLAEEKAQRLNAELEQRVARRTRELHAANEGLESFAYSVSHDLRAPLRHIHGFIELLAEHSRDVLDDEGRHYLETISAAAVRLGALIDDLLTFSRLGRQAVREIEVDMDRLVAQAIRETAPDTAGRMVEWRVGTLPAIRGDPTLLRVVADNLVSNAVKFTAPRDTAVIEIGCIEGSPDEVVYFVRDNGVGFDMAYAGNLFGVFQRLHRDEEFEGTGIGLANARRVVERCGGRIWADAAVDGGATFFFALPRGGKASGVS